ncbi:centromeric protein E [Nematocida sp. AWRm77]|nr:centromeric protein E [Nematocida sp. AWRm77]
MGETGGMEGNHRVKVGLRVKPPGDASCAETPADCVFSHHTNEEVYRMLVEPALKGSGLSTIFTYGRTGSGKTYTMFGCKESPGISARVLGALLAAHQVVYVRCIEIYNEVLTDLLTGKEVRLLQENERVRMCNEEQVCVEDQAGIDALLEKISGVRKTFETEHNKSSSRSHTVIEVLTAGVCVNLVDLAGNEKIGEDLERRKEGLLINKSLLTLGKVIDQLHRDTLHVSYRESKLTRILQSTLSGGTIVCICTVLSTDDVQTIKFAERLKRIKSLEKPAEKTKDEIIEDLQMRIKCLTAQLSRASAPEEESVLDTLNTLNTLDKSLNTLDVSLDESLESSHAQSASFFLREDTGSFITAEPSSVEEVDVLPERKDTPGTGTDLSLSLFPRSTSQSLSEGVTSGSIVESLHVDACTPHSQVNLYEMIYCYFRSEATQELANALSAEEMNKVHVTVTKKKRDGRLKNKFRTIHKESRTETRPYKDL